jgi:hypothetical protein
VTSGEGIVDEITRFAPRVMIDGVVARDDQPNRYGKQRLPVEKRKLADS